MLLHEVYLLQRTWEVVGANVEALYPSLDAVQVAEIIYKAIMETDVGLLALTMLREPSALP